MTRTLTSDQVECFWFVGRDLHVRLLSGKTRVYANAYGCSAPIDFGKDNAFVEEAVAEHVENLLLDEPKRGPPMSTFEVDTLRNEPKDF